MPLVGINSLHSSSSSTRDNREDYQSNESADDEQLQQGDPQLSCRVSFKPRPPRYPRPQSHLFFSPTTGRSLRGGRHTKRYQNC